MSGLRVRLARAQGDSQAQARIAARFGIGGVGGWSPASLSPLAWWDGTRPTDMSTTPDGAGEPPGAGGSVARWVDRESGVAIVRSTGTPPTWNGSDGVVFSEAVNDSLIEETSEKFNFLHNGLGGSVFVRLETSAGSGQRVVLMTNNRTSANVGMTLETNDGQVRPLVSSGGGWLNTASLGSIDAGIHDIVYSLTGQTVSLWIDGEPFTLVLSGAPSTDDHASDLAIGDDGSRDVDGPIEQLVLVGRAATQADVDAFGEWNP